MAVCYVKDRRTFRTKYKEHARYDVVLQSIYDEASTITLPGTEENVAAGDFVFVGGFCGVVKEAEPDGKQMRLTCGGFNSLFERNLLPVADSAKNGTEPFIKRQVDANFTNVADSVYRLPWLEVSAATTTKDGPPVGDGLWNLRNYMAEARRVQNIFVDFSVDGDVLRVDIARRQPQWHNIDLSMSGFEVLEEVTNTAAIGRITAYAKDTGGVSDWYRLADGGVSRSQPAAGRAEGAWESIIVGKAEDVSGQVADTFARNSYSHLLEFATERAYGFGDRVRIRTRRGQVVESYISSVGRRGGDSRTVYKTGEVRVLLSEALNSRMGRK